MQDEVTLWKWLIEHVAIPLLGGGFSAVSYWVHQLGKKLSDMRAQQQADTNDFHRRLSDLQAFSNDTYARRDDVREGFARMEGKLDILVKHALKDTQG